MKRIYVLLLCIVLFVGCSKKPAPVNNQIKSSDQTYMLGTLVQVSVYGKEVSKEAFEEVFQIIEDIEQKVSKNMPSSEVSRLNKGEKPTLSEETFNIIEKGIYYGEASGGKFDITIAPLVNLWGIDSENAKVPSEEAIKEALAGVDYRHITLEKTTKSAILHKPVELDLGGIAKGYVADRVSDYLLAHEMGHAIINLGGNILTVGRKPDGRPWKIGIQNPFDARGEKLGVVTIGQKSVVTSGIYERFLEEEGKKYHHILDPFTGYPVENELASVSILSNYSVDGDGLSTTVFAMGLEKGYNYVESLEDVDAIFVTKDKGVYLTQGARDVFVLTNYEYKEKKMD